MSESQTNELVDQVDQVGTDSNNNKDSNDYQQGNHRTPHISKLASEEKRQRLLQKDTDKWVSFSKIINN